MNISLAPEAIGTIGPITITNSLFSAIIVVMFLSGFILFITPLLRIDRPSKWQIFLEIIYTNLKTTASNILGHLTAPLFPLLLTIFIFILTSNWFGLLPLTGHFGINHHSHSGEVEIIPFFRAPTSDLSATIALALIAVITANYLGFKTIGIKYARKYLNFSNPLDGFVGILEIISELGKIVSFAFRLFGNIFAGEVMLAVITTISYGVATLPFFGLEIFVGFIQAFVFFMLFAVFINLSTQTSH